MHCSTPRMRDSTRLQQCKNRCKNPHLVHCVELFCCCLSNLINREVNKPCDLVKTQKRDRCKSELCQVFEVFLFLYLSNFQQYMIAFKMFYEQRQKHPLYQVMFALQPFIRGDSVGPGTQKLRNVLGVAERLLTFLRFGQKMLKLFTCHANCCTMILPVY